MILRAQNFQGFLDISGPELLEGDWLGNASQFRRSVKSGDTIEVPDEYLRFPNIKNAVTLGFLVVESYDSRDESLVINAEVSGFSGSSIPTTGTKFYFFDLIGGMTTILYDQVDGTPHLPFENGEDDIATWTVGVPGDYHSGDMVVEFFWATEFLSAGNVAWRLNWKSTPAGSSVAQAMSSVDLVQASPSGANLLATTGSALTIPAAAITLDSLLTIEVRRQGNAAGDTYTGQAKLFLVRMRYTGTTSGGAGGGGTSGASGTSGTSGWSGVSGASGTGGVAGPDIFCWAAWHG